MFWRILFVLIFFHLPFSIAIVSSANNSRKTCEPPYSQINITTVNFNEIQTKFSNDYIFVLNSQLDEVTQEIVIKIFHSIACLIPEYSEKIIFNLIILENNGISDHYSFHPNRTNFFKTFKPSISSPSSSTNQQTTHAAEIAHEKIKQAPQPRESRKDETMDVCEQLKEALNDFVIYKNHQKNSVKNYILFEFNGNYEHQNFGPEKCQENFNEFLIDKKLTDIVGIIVNIITIGHEDEIKLIPPPNAINETSVQKNPTFFSGAQLYIDGFEDYEAEVLVHLIPFVTEMINESINFTKAYTNLYPNKSILLRREKGRSRPKSTSKKSAPPIKFVTIFAVSFAIIILIIVIIISTINENYKNNFIWERIRRLCNHRRNELDSDRVNLVEVPMENLAQSAFGESSLIRSSSSTIHNENNDDEEYEAVCDVINNILPSENGGNNNNNPNLIIEIDNENLVNELSDVNLSKE